MIPHEAVAEASRAIDDDAYALLGWEGITRILEAALPHLISHEREETRLAHLDAVVNRDTASKLERAVDTVLDIANVRMDSEHGDPTFVAGWEAALEEVNARIKESIGGSENE